MRINCSIVVRAPREVVWDQITDPAAYRDFMSGITRWELQDEGDSSEREGGLELGSRIRMLIQVGSAEVGGLIEVVEFKPGSDMAWSSVTGVDQRGRWRLRGGEGGLTRVELRYSYGVAGGGLTGMLAERVAAPMLRRRLRRSLLGLKQYVEREARHREADARRRSTAGQAA